MICQGFRGNTYDLYVLGLLGPAERAEIDSHVHSQCSACILGVQRSMRLWVVFTSSLKDAEPSADFRTRLLQIVELSKSVLTFPKNSAVAEPARRPRPISLAIAAVLAGVLTLSGWLAGHTSAGLDRQNLTTQFVRQGQALATAQLELQRLRALNGQSLTSGKGDGKTASSGETRLLGRRLSETEAALNQYKSLLERQQRALDDRSDVLNLLSSSDARLLPLKAAAQFEGVGYIMLLPNERLALICSNVPGLPRGKEYQLWVLRKSESAPANGGVFVPDHEGKAYVQIDNPSVVSGLAGIAVTDEPAGGSSSPTGSKLFTLTCEQGDLAHCSSE